MNYVNSDGKIVSLHTLMSMEQSERRYFVEVLDKPTHRLVDGELVEIFVDPNQIELFPEGKIEFENGSSIEFEKEEE